MLREPIQVEQLVEDILADAMLEAESKGVRLEPTSLIPATVSGDEELLRRAIENVVRNAIRYTRENTGVEVEVRPVDSQARIAVRDFGPGVPADALDRIFDPFYRVGADRNRASGGAGLGLAIAKRAVELHQGSIHAANVDPGLLIEILIPAAR
jgi:two-component system sensor histidine kinase CpxA